MRPEAALLWKQLMPKKGLAQLLCAAANCIY